jgi:hypothetical protein
MKAPIPSGAFATASRLQRSPREILRAHRSSSSGANAPTFRRRIG